MKFEKEVMDSIRNCVHDAVKKHISDYSSPLKSMVFECVKDHEEDFRKLVSESLDSVFLDESFRESAKQAIRHKVARELSTQFGEGVFKKHIQALKGDPTIRARAVLAIEGIIESAEAEGE
jgi:hypothetical protein